MKTVFCLLFWFFCTEIARADSRVMPAISLLLLPSESATCEIPNDYFSGVYLMEQLTGQDPFFAEETFGDTQYVFIEADGNQRTFWFVYFINVPQMIRIYDFNMTLTCEGEIQVSGVLRDGDYLGCDGMQIGPSIGFSTGTPISTYALGETADDIVLVNVTDFNPDGNCGDFSYQVELRFTEL